MNKKHILLTLIVTTTLIIGVVYFIIQNKITASELAYKTFQQYKKQCNPSLMSDTEKITTYTNGFYGFTFNIPDDYVVCEIGSENKNVLNLHITPRVLFMSQNASLTKDAALKLLTDSLFIQITKGTLPGLPQVKIKEMLPNRMIGGIESSVGIADLIGCTKKSCPKITVHRFLRDGFQYEFSATKPFDTVLNSFVFLPKK